MIRNREGGHSTGYLRHKKAGEHLHHSFEVFVRCREICRVVLGSRLAVLFGLVFMNLRSFAVIR
jgi:hypothetical protein